MFVTKTMTRLPIYTSPLENNATNQPTISVASVHVVGGFSALFLRKDLPRKEVEGKVKDVNLFGVMCSTSLRLSHNDFWERV